MINNKIKFSIFTIVLVICFAIIMLFFLKIEKSCSIQIIISDFTSYCLIDSKDSAYIQKNDIDYISVYYDNKYYDSNIVLIDSVDDYDKYSITLSSSIYKNEDFLMTNCIFDSCSFWSYVFN